MEKPWTTRTGLTREEFEKFTLYVNRSDNHIDNENRARALGFTQENLRIAPGAIVRVTDPTKIGAHSFIGLYTYVNGDVTIGEGVAIGPHCSLSAGNHVFSPEHKDFRHAHEFGPIVIGDGSWLAAGCMVTAGVTVGKCNLVCANTVVTKDTPDYAIVAGTPGRVIGRIDPETGAYEWLSKSEPKKSEEE